MQQTLDRTLRELEVVTPVSQGLLGMFPLVAVLSDEEELVLLEVALEEETLQVEELGESGRMPELRLVNGGVRPIQVLEGDELVGAKQKRGVNSSVLVVADSELTLPVSCVERGRWSYRSRAFSSGSGSLQLLLRRLKSRTVHDSLKRGRGHRSPQGTSPLFLITHIRAARLQGRVLGKACRLREARGQAPRGHAWPGRRARQLPGAGSGASRPVHLRNGLPQAHLSGYVFEAISAERHAEQRGDIIPDPLAVRALIESAVGAPHEEHWAVGMGRDVRFEVSGASGYALVSEQDVLHAAIFAK